MRVAGALTLIAGWFVAAIFALLPAEISILGTSISCGPPVVATFLTSKPTGSEIDVALAKECYYLSVQRTAIGGVIWAIATLGAGGMVIASLRRP